MKNILPLILLLITSVVSSCGLGYHGRYSNGDDEYFDEDDYVYKEDYEELKDKYEELQAEYDELEKKYSDLLESTCTDSAFKMSNMYIDPDNLYTKLNIIQEYYSSKGINLGYEDANRLLVSSGYLNYEGNDTKFLDSLFHVYPHP